MRSLADEKNDEETTELVPGFLCKPCNSVFSQGLDTYIVPMSLYQLNRARLVSSMVEKLGSDNAQGLILLEGGKQTTRYDTDHEPVFRQESYFHWTFGVSEADVYGAISLPSGESVLFVPQYNLSYEIVCGKSPTLEEMRITYGVDKVLPLDQISSYVSSELALDDENNNARLHLLSGLNSDSGNMAKSASYKEISEHRDKQDTSTLFACIAGCRVNKTSAEIEIMRYTHWVSSMAHVEVQRYVKVGMMEYQLESLFQHHTYTHGGCRHMSYTCICACGPNPAILHYGHAGRPNNRQLCDGDIALLDMGAEYHCYASDITCSFPVNGKFTEDQKMVYEGVLAAQVAVINAMKPGVPWTDMHRTAEKEILRNLKSAGLLIGDIDKMIQNDLGAIFMPHGLGHFIGVDTHDVGGYATGMPERVQRPGINKLRTARVLEAGMVLTVEPGCYFIDPLLDMALTNPKQAGFMNADRIQHFRGFGGVRLEDGVLVTSDGSENLTLCPRAISEVLDVMSGGVWPPKKDVMPELKRSWVRRESGKMVPFQLQH